MNQYLLKAVLTADKKLTFLSEQVFVRGENECCSLTVEVPEEWRGLDYVILFECPKGRAFASAVLRAEGSPPTIAYSVGSGILSCSGRVNIQIAAKDGSGMVIKSVIGQDSGFFVNRSVENVVDAYSANDILTAITDALGGIDELFKKADEDCFKVDEACENAREFVAFLKESYEKGELSGKDGEKGEKGDRGDNGDKGEKGEDGDSFKVSAWYADLAAMSDSLGGHAEGDLAGILYSEGSADSGKLFVKADGVFRYVTTITGVKGEKGDAGDAPRFTVSAFTVADGSGASAVVSGTNENPHLTIGVPAGEKGDTGAAGTKGDKGNTGDKGDTGDAGATPNISVAAVALATGATPTAVKSGTALNPLITFGLPAGIKGDRGDKGDIGATPSISVNTVTLAANYSAYCIVSGTAETPLFTLGVPRGYNGENAVYPTPVPVTISASQWSGAQVTVSGFAVENAQKIHIDIPVPTTQANAEAIINAGIYVTAVTTSSITFRAKTTPTSGVTLWVRGVASA